MQDSARRLDRDRCRPAVSALRRRQLDCRRRRASVTQWSVSTVPPSRTNAARSRAIRALPTAEGVAAILRRRGRAPRAGAPGQSPAAAARPRRIVLRLDRPAPADPAGCVVVLGEGQPFELDEGRPARARRPGPAPWVRNVSTFCLVDLLDSTRAEVGPRGLGRVGDSGPLLHVGAGQPARATGVRRGAADTGRSSRAPRSTARPAAPGRRRSARHRPNRPPPRRTP